MSRKLLARLRPLLADYGLADARLRTLATTGDIVVRVRPRRPVPGLPAGGAVLRLYDEQDRAAGDVQSEIDWLRAMTADGLHVPPPIADYAGRRQREFTLADGTRFAGVLVGWVDGQFLDARQTPTHMTRLGRLIGAMHAHADRLDARNELAGQRAAYTGDLCRWAEQRDLPERVPGTLRDVAAAAARRVGAELAGIERRPGEWGFLHGDLHFGNYLFRRGEAGVIDFGVCGRGPRALDLAAALQAVARPIYGNHYHCAHHPAMRDALLSGYVERMPFTAAMQAQVEVCAVARVFVTLSWMAWDWPHVRRFPWGPDLLRGAEAVFREYLDG